jgi:hypothetical protein
MQGPARAVVPIEMDLCQEHNNQLEHGSYYDFFQFSYSKRKHTKFYLGMSAVNDQQQLFENKYHGWSKNSDTPFTRGSFFIERPINDEIANAATFMKYDKELARSLKMNGGFLQGKHAGATWCLSTLKDDNYVAADNKASTRVQHNRCPS